MENGLVLKGHRLIVPESLRTQMLSLVLQRHMGTEKCLLRAKDCMFSPGISKDIKELISNCSTCIKYAKQQPKERLLQYNLPSFPWQRLGSDLFHYNGCQYLLVADYFSKFPVIRKLSTTTTSAIIHHLRSILAEHGIPEELVTDNGPQYSSHEFKKFCSEWGITHTTSSPLYPQSNGFSERMVQTVKNLLKKSQEAGEDPYIALLNYRTTPVDSKLQAPAKLLNQRNYRTLLPSSGRQQRLKTNDDDPLYLQRRQESQRQQHGQWHRRELEDLSSGQAVAVYNPSSKTWTTAEVKDKLDEPRSYVVKTTNGSELRRNRIHLKPVAEEQTAKQTSSEEMPVPRESTPSKPPSRFSGIWTCGTYVKYIDIDFLELVVDLSSVHMLFLKGEMSQYWAPCMSREHAC